MAAVPGFAVENRVIVQSFDYRTLHAMKKLAPELPLSALYTGPARDFAEIAKRRRREDHIAGRSPGDW